MKLSDKSHQGAPIVIIFLVIFAGTALKYGLFFSMFNLRPPLPSAATDDMKQFQCLNIVFTLKKSGPLSLEFNWCEDTF